MIRIPVVIPSKPRPGEMDECLKGLTTSIGFRYERSRDVTELTNRDLERPRHLNLSLLQLPSKPRLHRNPLGLFIQSSPIPLSSKNVFQIQGYQNPTSFHCLVHPQEALDSRRSLSEANSGKNGIKLGMQSTYCSLRLLHVGRDTFETPCTVWNEEDSNSGK